MIEQRLVADALFAARERAEVTLNSIGDAVLSTDLLGRVTYLNLAAEAMTGWSREAAAGRPLDEIFHIITRQTREVARDPMSLAVELDKTVGLTPNCILVRRDGRETEIEDSAAPIHDKHGRVTGAVIVFRDVGSALEASRQMSHLAQHDVVTGLPNRLLLNDRLSEAIALGHRRSKPIAVGFLDIDGFKDINDVLGHAAGDQLLRSIGGRLSGALRESDTVSRYGGDEFVIVLSEIEHAADAARVARKILQAVTEPYRINGREIGITASLGVTLYPDHGRDANTLIANADAAMYGAKRAGLGQYQIFDVGTNSLARDRRSLEADLHGALGRDEFELHYQPQIDLATGAIVGVEALMRWRHPQRGLLTAAQFLSIAGDCGLMVPIGLWAIGESCRQARAWRDAGLPPVLIAVNVSAVEFWRQDFVGNVQAILRDTGLDADHLELELTEDILIHDMAAAVAALHALKGLGVHVAVDHFGTGHLSLSDLQQFPIDVLKVDRAFIREIVGATGTARVLSAIIGLGKSLDHRVMATGVETDCQLAFLRAQHCPEAQGNLFSPPVVADRLGELLATGVGR